MTPDRVLIFFGALFGLLAVITMMIPETWPEDRVMKITTAISCIALALLIGLPR